MKKCIYCNLKPDGTINLDLPYHVCEECGQRMFRSRRRDEQLKRRREQLDAQERRDFAWFFQCEDK